jgi:hypothetical protein
MKLIGEDLSGPQAGKGLEMNPKAHRIPPGSPVGTGTGNKRLKDHDVPGLGTLEGVNGVVKLDFCFLNPQTGVVSGTGSQEDHIQTPHGTVEGNFHFPVGKTIRVDHANPVDNFSKGNKTGKPDQVLCDPGSVTPHRPGSGNDKIIHDPLDPLWIFYKKTNKI